MASKPISWRTYLQLNRQSTKEWNGRGGKGLKQSRSVDDLLGGWQLAVGSWKDSEECRGLNMNECE